MVNRKEKSEADPTDTVSVSGLRLDQMPIANFLDALRGVRKGTAPLEEGHKSVAMLHQGNIAWSMNRELDIDPANGHIKNDPEAMKLWRRDYERGWEPKV